MSGSGSDSVRVAPRQIGRYWLFEEIAFGGMASVHLGRSTGDAGFARTVAVKRLHPQYAKDPEFVAMLVDEGRIAERIRHPNVVSVLDVVAANGELLLVMEYVHGESLGKLLATERAAGKRAEPAIVSAVVVGLLQGLHAAHDARDANGTPLGIVHRDVSPENVLVGVDGIPRVLDFGIAMAAERVQTTRDGQLKGKLGYIAPEQLSGKPATPAADVYAAGVVLWQALTGRKLFEGPNEAAIMMEIVQGEVQPPSRFATELPAGVDEVVLKAIARDPASRYASADELASALETALPPAKARDVSRWVNETAKTMLASRSALLARVEREGTETTEGVRAEVSRVSIPVLAGLPAPELTSAGATMSTPAPPKRQRWWLAALAALGLVGLGAGISGLWMAKDGQPASQEAAYAGSVVSAPTVVTKKDAPTASAGEPAIVVAPATSATAVVSSSASPRASAKQPVATSDAKPPAQRGANCNPDYVVDAQGVKRYKKECLR
jgi:serine/threonine-protein kinase